MSSAFDQVEDDPFQRMKKDLEITSAFQKDMLAIQLPMQVKHEVTKDIIRSVRDDKITDLGYAEVIFDRLSRQIKAFEKSLKRDEEVGACLASFGVKISISVENLGYHNPYLIVFSGTDTETGQRVRLIQHTSQVSVLLVALKVEEAREPRRVGFCIEQPDKNPPGE